MTLESCLGRSGRAVGWVKGVWGVGRWVFDRGKRIEGWNYGGGAACSNNPMRSNVENILSVISAISTTALSIPITPSGRPSNCSIPTPKSPPIHTRIKPNPNLNPLDASST